MKAGEVTITRAWLKQRCEREGSHLIWTLSCGNGGPRGHARDANGKEGQFSVRHAAWSLYHGEILPKGMTARPSCGDERCLSKSCLEKQPHGGYNRGRPRSLLTKQRIAVTNRAKFGHPPELVERIRSSEGSLAKVAAECGVSLCTVECIRSGRRWRDYSNPFAGLGA